MLAAGRASVGEGRRKPMPQRPRMRAYLSAGCTPQKTAHSCTQLYAARTQRRAERVREKIVRHCQSVMGMEKLVPRQIGLLIMIVIIIVIAGEGKWAQLGSDSDKATNTPTLCFDSCRMQASGLEDFR